MSGTGVTYLVHGRSGEFLEWDARRQPRGRIEFRDPAAHDRPDLKRWILSSRPFGESFDIAQGPLSRAVDLDARAVSAIEVGKFATEVDEKLLVFEGLLTHYSC